MIATAGEVEQRIRLGDAVSLVDMASWGQTATHSVVFELTKNSAFSMLAEGPAVAKLRELTTRGLSVKVSFPFSSHDDVLKQPPRMLGGLFGLSLISAADSVQDAQGLDAKAALHSKLWHWTQVLGGKIGRGQRTSIVFRDPDYLIPACLRFGKGDDFPLPSNFINVLTDVGQKLIGDKFGSTIAEGTALSFLHEATKNAHEHGRYDALRQPVSGIRGIVAEKQLFLNKEELESRKQIPEVIRHYMQRIWVPRGSEHSIVAITVTDLGAGIHNTLPQLPNESGWDRLNRAFKLGVSRKPAGSGPNRGIGFTQILKAASKVRAFLFVRSAELAGYKDFSEQRNCKNLENGFSLDPWLEESTLHTGTSLSLVWSPKIATLQAFSPLGPKKERPGCSLMARDTFV